MTAEAEPRARRRLGLSARILLGLALGIFTGLFFGEPAGILQPVVDVYIRLMQMTVLPYLMLALVVGFGQLEPERARSLAGKAGVLLLATWTLMVVLLSVMPLTFPNVENASFFSHSLVEPRQPFAIADLYFTANPFHALATGIVPAVVLFSSMLGIWLMAVDDRERVLGVLRVLNVAIAGITTFIVRTTPIGVFAIGAVTAGTMTLETIERLWVYLVAFSAAALLLTFLILPLLVSAVTPIRLREVVAAAGDALLTAFVANNAFIVLPILVERAKALLERRALFNAETATAPDVLIPILFNFPNAGRLLTLLFVPFAAWLAGSPLSGVDYPTLFAVGIPTYFAKAQVALPFLMDLFELPHDLFQLYIATTLIGGKFDSMATAMNLFVFALLGAAAMGGFLEFRRRRLLRAAATLVAGIAVTVILVRVLLAVTVDTTYHRDQELRRMHSPRGEPAIVVTEASPGEEPAPIAPRVPGLDRIRADRRLRVGFDPDYAPFSYFNADGQLVGFDVELAAALAQALGVVAEFVPVEWSQVPEKLAGGAIDVMPGIWYRPYWFSTVRLTEPYITQTMALVVPDRRRHEFADLAALRRSHGLRIGVPLDSRQVESSLRHYFGRADVEFVPVDSPADFWSGRVEGLDAYLITAESGAAGSLLHPQFSVVVPQPDPIEVPTALGVAPAAADLAEAADEWIVFAASEGTIQRAYDYWVLGRGAADDRPRWSVLRNVLGFRDQRQKLEPIP